MLEIEDEPSSNDSDAATASPDAPLPFETVQAVLETAASTLSSTMAQPPVALVTGAAKRLGREIALALAQQGWSVLVHYHHAREEAEETVALIRQYGTRAECYAADLADETALPGLVAAARALGDWSCLINNASRFDDDSGPSFHYASLQAHMLPNLAAPLALTRLLAEQLPEQARAVVVNLLDQKLEFLNPDFLSYTMSKAALKAATIMLAQQYAPRLRVVGVSPGLTMISHLQTPEAFERTHQQSPLGYGTQPEDIAQAVCFAVSNPAITGTTLVVDAGQHLMGFRRDFSKMVG